MAPFPASRLAHMYRVMLGCCSLSSSASTHRMIELSQLFSFFLLLISLPELIHSVEVLLSSFHTGSSPKTKADNPWGQPATSDLNQRLFKQDTSLQGLDVFILMGFFFSLCFAFSSPGSLTPSPLSGSDGIFVGFVLGPPWDYPSSLFPLKAHSEFPQHWARGCCPREEQTANDWSVYLTYNGWYHFSAYTVELHNR